MDFYSLKPWPGSGRWLFSPRPGARQKDSREPPCPCQWHSAVSWLYESAPPLYQSVGVAIFVIKPDNSSQIIYIIFVHRWLCLLFKCFRSQPAQYQGFTAHRRYFYRCFLPDLTEFKICLLRKAENINTTYGIAYLQQNSPTGIQSCIKRVSGYREPLTPHLAQIKVFNCNEEIYIIIK